MTLPIVALIGRPNVGKSTFFNAVTRTRDALVDNLAGVTRDRHYGTALWNDIPFMLVDTGGFIEGPEDRFMSDIRFQIVQALEEADAVVLMLDGREGLSPYDQDLASMVRHLTKPILVAVNKIDGSEQEVHLGEFYALGRERLYAVSAEHRYGMNTLLDDLVAELPAAAASSETDRERIRVAVVGRPNVGKSSLINRVLGDRRLVVSEEPGTTRDSIDTAHRVDGCDYLLIDTAGIRRKGRVSHRLEKFSVLKALRSLERCDVALIVLDAAEGVTDQDVTVAGYAHERGCGCVFVLNKWDLVAKSPTVMREYRDRLQAAAKFLHFAPMVTVSAKTGQRVGRVFAAVQTVYAQYRQRVATGPINRLLTAATERTPPPVHRGRRLKFYYAAQVSTRPPTFVTFVNHPEAVHFSYRRFLANQIREGFGLTQTPVRLYLRKRQGDRRAPAGRRRGK